MKNHSFFLLVSEIKLLICILNDLRSLVLTTLTLSEFESEIVESSARHDDGVWKTTENDIFY